MACRIFKSRGEIVHRRQIFQVSGVSWYVVHVGHMMVYASVVVMVVETVSCCRETGL
jgi:hypothetical protein